MIHAGTAAVSSPLAPWCVYLQERRAASKASGTAPSSPCTLARCLSTKHLCFGPGARVLSQCSRSSSSPIEGRTHSANNSGLLDSLSSRLSAAFPRRTGGLFALIRTGRESSGCKRCHGPSCGIKEPMTRCPPSLTRYLRKARPSLLSPPRLLEA